MLPKYQAEKSLILAKAYAFRVVAVIRLLSTLELRNKKTWYGSLKQRTEFFGDKLMNGERAHRHTGPVQVQLLDGIDLITEWVYLYRAVDKLGKTFDFMLSKRRNKAGRDPVLCSGFGSKRPAAEDCDRPERSEHSWYQRDKLLAEIIRLPNPDRDGSDQVSQQHR